MELSERLVSLISINFSLQQSGARAFSTCPFAGNRYVYVNGNARQCKRIKPSSVILRAVKLCLFVCLQLSPF